MNEVVPLPHDEWMLDASNDSQNGPKRLDKSPEDTSCSPSRDSDSPGQTEADLIGAEVSIDQKLHWTRCAQVSRSLSPLPWVCAKCIVLYC